MDSVKWRILSTAEGKRRELLNSTNVDCKSMSCDSPQTQALDFPTDFSFCSQPLNLGGAKSLVVDGSLISHSTKERALSRNWTNLIHVRARLDSFFLCVRLKRRKFYSCRLFVRETLMTSPQTISLEGWRSKGFEKHGLLRMLDQESTFKYRFCKLPIV